MYGYIIFCLVTVCAWLPTLLVYGYANQLYTFKLAALHYPIFIFTTDTIAQKLLLGIQSQIIDSPYYNAVVIGAVAFLHLIIWLGSRVNTSSFKSLETKPIAASTPGSWAALAFLVVFAVIINGLIQLLFITGIKTLGANGSQAYSDDPVTSLLWLKNLCQIGVGLAAIAIGFYLYKRGSSAWQLGIRGIYVLMALFCLHILYVAFYYINIDMKTFVFNASILSALGVAWMYFKELAYFALDIRERFRAKLWLDGVFWLLFPAASLPQLLSVALIDQQGHMPTVFQLVVCTFVLLMIAFAIAYWAIRKVQVSFKQSDDNQSLENMEVPILSK